MIYIVSAALIKIHCQCSKPSILFYKYTTIYLSILVA